LRNVLTYFYFKTLLIFPPERRKRGKRRRGTRRKELDGVVWSYSFLSVSIINSSEERGKKEKLSKRKRESR